MSVTTLKAPRISGRDRVIVLPNGKVALQSKGRRKYKLSASKRKRIAASLRRFKLPVLTTAAVAYPLFSAVGAAGGINNVFTANGSKRFGGYLLAAFTGFDLATGRWNIRSLQYGLLPVAAVMLINKSGILKPVNQKLARMRIPLRLS